MKKLISILVAFAMMAMLSITAFAAGEGKPAENGEVYLTKTLKIAAGLNGPQQFNFVATPKTVDGNAYEAATTGENAKPANMPAITIPATTKMQGTATDGDIIENVKIDLNTVAWPHAGEYIYEITEVVPADIDANNTKDGVTYDTGKYTLRVVIANKAGGGYEVAGAEVKDEQNNKVDPTKPNDEDTTDEDDGFNANGVNFENKYAKVADDTDTNGEDPNDPSTPVDEDHASFMLTKTVPTTNNGDLTKPSKFTLSIAQPETAPETATLTYYKYTNGAWTKIDSLDNLTLANGEKLAVYGAYVGTKYTVEEDLSTDTAAGRYTASATVNASNGLNADKITPATIEQGDNVKITDAIVIDNDQNVAAYTNTKAPDSTPTGILISNLPYIALALVAIGGLVAYVVVRRRNADEA